MKKYIIFLICIVLSTSVSFQCANLGINIFSDQDDVKLGQQLDSEIRNNPKEYPVLQNRTDVKNYVEQIGRKILNSPDITKKDVYAYKFEIIKSDSTINAFATPGGYVYVYTGLLKFVDNEATLAGILAHEIAHAERRHATQRMSKYYGASILVSIILGENPSQYAEMAANLFTGVAFLANSRADEKEADEWSIKYLRSTEYYPGAIKYFFDKIQSEKGSHGGTLERLLSTHPLPQDRIDDVNRILQNIGNPLPVESNIFAKRYKNFKSTLP
jgi:beta-barrel assembly-enhancing protease